MEVSRLQWPLIMEFALMVYLIFFYFLAYKQNKNGEGTKMANSLWLITWILILIVLILLYLEQSNVIKPLRAETYTNIGKLEKFTPHIYSQNIKRCNRYH